MGRPIGNCFAQGSHDFYSFKMSDNDDKVGAGSDSYILNYWVRLLNAFTVMRWYCCLFRMNLSVNSMVVEQWSKHKLRRFPFSVEHCIE